MELESGEEREVGGAKMGLKKNASFCISVWEKKCVFFFFFWK